MRLEEFWGVGPKTREVLVEELGESAAIAAIEAADSRRLVDAGLSRGRATRILRRAKGGEGMDVLATRDTREVYKDILDVASEFAVTRHAEDRIRVLTPLRDPDAVEARLDTVLDAADAWRALDADTREQVVAAFESHDSGGSEQSAVETALALAAAGVSGGAFAGIEDIDTDALEEARDALAVLGDGSVGEGADGELDTLREQSRAAEELAANQTDLLEAVQSDVRGTDEFREAALDRIASDTGVDVGRVREAMPSDAPDAAGFLGETLRTLTDDLREAVADREAEVAADLEGAVEAARADIDAAVELVDDAAFYVSLARFVAGYDLTRPTYVDDRDALAVVNARNLTLAADDEQSVQPVHYGIGDHEATFPRAPVPPSGDRVAVLTGANSGGKTTLLETLCQVQLLAQMGLPVPADAAEVSLVDVVVFHRRHASFNAGVLESTLRTIVPPLTEADRPLMLVDEFEAITEPGSAADLLHGLVTLTVDRDAIGVFVTHLADDLQPLPDTARTDGIFAEGLTPDLELAVDYQPRFGTVGKSTPEFIVSRLVADADDHTERAGFETLARAVGQEAVQRTLADARWSN